MVELQEVVACHSRATTRRTGQDQPRSGATGRATPGEGGESRGDLGVAPVRRMLVAKPSGRARVTARRITSPGPAGGPAVQLGRHDERAYPWSSATAAPPEGAGGRRGSRTPARPLSPGSTGAPPRTISSRWATSSKQASGSAWKSDDRPQSQVTWYRSACEIGSARCPCTQAPRCFAHASTRAVSSRAQGALTASAEGPRRCPARRAPGHRAREPPARRSARHTRAGCRSEAAPTADVCVGSATCGSTWGRAGPGADRPHRGRDVGLPLRQVAGLPRGSYRRHLSMLREAPRLNDRS